MSGFYVVSRTRINSALSVHPMLHSVQISWNEIKNRVLRTYTCKAESIIRARSWNMAVAIHDATTHDKIVSDTLTYAEKAQAIKEISGILDEVIQTVVSKHLR